VRRASERCREAYRRAPALAQPIRSQGDPRPSPGRERAPCRSAVRNSPFLVVFGLSARAAGPKSPCRGVPARRERGATERCREAYRRVARRPRPSPSAPKATPVHRPGASGRRAARRSVFGRFWPVGSSRGAKIPMPRSARAPRARSDRAVPRGIPSRAGPCPAHPRPRRPPSIARARAGAVPLGGAPARPSSPFLAIFGLSARAAGRKSSCRGASERCRREAYRRAPGRTQGAIRTQGDPRPSPGRASGCRAARRLSRLGREPFCAQVFLALGFFRRRPDSPKCGEWGRGSLAERATCRVRSPAQPQVPSRRRPPQTLSDFAPRQGKARHGTIELPKGKASC